MIDITIKDNYFLDVDHVRELGIRNRSWRISDKPETGAEITLPAYLRNSLSSPKPNIEVYRRRPT